MAISSLKQGVSSSVLGTGIIYPLITEGSSTNGSFSNITDTTNWRLGTWTSSGSLVVANSGWLNVWMISGGGGGVTNYGSGAGGSVCYGWFYYPAGTYTVTVGNGGTGGQWPDGRMAGFSGIGSIARTNSSLYGQASGTPSPGNGTGFTTTFSGSSITYGLEAQASPRANRGDGGAQPSTSGSTGIVYVRVPR